MRTWVSSIPLSVPELRYGMDLYPLCTKKKAREESCSSGAKLQNLMSATGVMTMRNKVRNNSIFFLSRAHDFGQTLRSMASGNDHGQELGAKLIMET